MVTLTASDLSISLGGRVVLDHVSATFSAGQITGIIGPNGAGKSTLARALAGLVAPANGAILLDDQDIAAMPLVARARTIAYLPQRETVHWPVSVERLVLTGRLPHIAPLSRPQAKDRAIVADALARTGMTDYAERNVLELSGGELARAMLARMIAADGDVLIADEPFAALDYSHRFALFDLLQAQAVGGKLVIVVLHDLDQALRHCDRLLLLSEGHLIADGPAREVLSAPTTAQAFDVDFTVRDDGSGTHLIATAH